MLFTIFAFALFTKEQYLFVWLTLPLILAAWRIKDIRKLSAKWVSLELEGAKEKNRKILESDKPLSEKIQLAEDLLEEVFLFGYKAAGGDTEKISNIKFWKGNKGETNYQYDEES